MMKQDYTAFQNIQFKSIQFKNTLCIVKESLLMLLAAVSLAKNQNRLLAEDC